LTAKPTILPEDVLKEKGAIVTYPFASDLNYYVICKTPENLQDLIFSRKLLQRTTKEKQKTAKWIYKYGHNCLAPMLVY